MEFGSIPRLYADVAKNLSRGWLETGAAAFAANRRLRGAASLWGDEVQAAGNVLFKAARRSGEETRATLDTSDGLTEAAAARFGDLARAQAFLWASATLAAGERLGRAASAGSVALLGSLPGADLFSLAPPPRLFVLGTVAADLWSGYASLRERARWLPGTVEDEDWELQHERGANRVLDAASALGGTLIKAAQFASSRPDLLPAAYTTKLAELQDRVPPQPWTVIEGAVTREIGRPLSEAFEEFDREPIAAASIAQVHRARLTDGREVAVKVQYPGVKNLIEADLTALEAIFGAIKSVESAVDLNPILSYLRWTLPMELDFVREARAIEELRAALEHRDDVVVPRVIEGFNTERLLVMELMEGVKITDKEGLVAAGLDPEAVAKLFVEVYADQLFEIGVFHADPHPGNLLVQAGPKGPRLVLLDHGLTLSVPPELVASLSEAITAISEGDFETLTGALERAGLDLDPNLELTTLLGVVGVLMGGDLGEPDGAEGADGNADLSEFALDLGSSIGSIPNDLLLVGRAIGLLDGTVRQLAPGLDSIEIVARYAQAT